MTMKIRDQRICEVIAASPEAESILEEAGIDYWFGWEQGLRPACEAADIDPDVLAARLIPWRSSGDRESREARLETLLHISYEHWRHRLAPAITTGITTASRLRDDRGEAAVRLLSELQLQFDQHMGSIGTLVPVAGLIERGQAGLIGRGTIRNLCTAHLELERIAGDLRWEACQLALHPDLAGLVATIRVVIREIHRHIKVAHNFILPRFVAAATAADAN